MARPATVAPNGTQLSELELVARVFRTLGEFRRLSIIELLLETGALSQSEISRRLEIPQSRISDHLNCLVWCGFLVAEPRGRRVVYRVAGDAARQFVALARDFLRDNTAGLGSCRELQA
jgi:predicted transcriptional regulator